MNRKLIVFILACLMLTSCKRMTRTDVVDVLLDNNYMRNASGFYEKHVEDYIIRIGYRRSIDRYFESLENYFGPGPSALIDIGNNVSFNYHLNEDVLLYNVYCAKELILYNSEVMYFFKDQKFIVGTDDCAFNIENQDPLIEEFNNRKEMIILELEDIKLGKKELALLK